MTRWLRPAVYGGCGTNSESGTVLSALLSGENVRDFEGAFARKDGSFFSVRCAASPFFAAGSISGHVVEIQDVTAERQRAQALERSEARFAQLADAVPQLAWMAQADGDIV